MTISWTKSLYGRLVLAVLLFVLVSILLVASTFLVLQRVQSNVSAASHLGKERAFYQLLYRAARLPAPTAPGSQAGVSQLLTLMERNEETLGALIEGSETLHVPAIRDPHILAQLEESRQYWTTQVRPALEGAIENAPLNRSTMDNLDRLIHAYASRLDRQIGLMEQAAIESVERSRYFLAGFSAAAVLILLLVLGIVRHVARRTRLLAETAEEISGGNLSERAPVAGNDELALLGSAFNAMTAKLSAMIDSERAGKQHLEALLATISETAQQLSSSVSDILTGTSQQVEGMREQSAAVAETVTGVDQVLETAEQAVQRAEAVATSAEKAVGVSTAGRKAIEQTVATMKAVSERTEAVSADILSLAENCQEIGEIVTVVTEIADQTNLLALNASIEASRAGEHGHGFSVVATEIRTLADQSKAATAKVRRILLDIQKATNTAVIEMEEGASSVNRGLEAVNEAGDTIRQLETMIADAARSAAQIAASAGQQRAGMKQIHEAMHHIENTTSQNLAAVRQAEQAARDLNELGNRLNDMLEGPRQ